MVYTTVDAFFFSFPILAARIRNLFTLTSSYRLMIKMNTVTYDHIIISSWKISYTWLQQKTNHLFHIMIDGHVYQIIHLNVVIKASDHTHPVAIEWEWRKKNTALCVCCIRGRRENLSFQQQQRKSRNTLEF